MFSNPLHKQKRISSRAFLNRQRKDYILALFFLLPTFYVLFKTYIFPIYQSFIWSFFKYNLMENTDTSFVGIRNYSDILQSTEFWVSMKRTIYFTGVSVFLELIFGFFCALLLNEIFKGRIIFRVIIIIPWALLTLVNGLLWKYIYQPGYGAFTQLLRFLHIIDPNSNPVWLSNSDNIINFVILSDVWKCTPFITLILLAGMQSISGNLYEAAMIDGAGFWAKIRLITIPQLLPSIIIAIVLRTMGAFKVYDILTVFTGDPTTSVSYLTFNNAFRYFYLGNASAMAWISTLFMLLLIIIYIRILKRNTE
ncbi:carbohydrate ABC transporter membrane protein 1 (CUT1 family) [Scopulibacillus darangshiensis]|uniref:Carbohydrate ABC transporter membrane protein 1 (CUT1 family) n=1 Tax=Scopulibacillus darangshiensis TaxID=442528 RepID=A0A4R2P7Q1_9BACL|nr:sugar ABC transporter permease [Scopulibacillus darangshiensis]TCP30970.1 carbohydrate ABC transporter membrane protein 1 (CUT1 family) [Scopulibacillus darangshiensis]